jgi:energy-coupling factor transport system substrate-specific component
MNRQHFPHALHLGIWSWAAIGATSLIGLAAFFWPFIAEPGSAAVAHASDAPWVFAALIPLVLIVVIAQVLDGGMDAKAVAMLGVLAAVIAILRPLGAGIAGIEPIWVVLILGARVFGPGFGFALGSISLFASALLTGGVGPWLPFQMIAAAWIGLGAGLLPAVRGRAEVIMVATYGAIAAMLYGLLLNLWLWPFVATDTQIAFIPGDPVAANLTRWIAFTLATSMAFDIPRALLTGGLILVSGSVVITALRRASRRAAFAAPVAFEPAGPPTRASSSDVT